MNKKRKKLRFNKLRRTPNRADLFPKKEIRDIGIKDYFLRIAFPDFAERMAYISALIKGLEEEPVIPDTQFIK